MELKLLTLDEASRWLELQKETYASYLEEYQDCESHPAADTIAMVSRRFTKPNCHHYFAYLDNIVVGAIRIVWQEGTNKYEIADLFVLPRFQNAGYGKRIVKLAETLYPGASSWELWTELQSPRNHYFYESLGYRKTEDILVLNDKAALILFRKGK